MSGTRKVRAVHPYSGEIVTAVMKLDHFGSGKHAINFGTINSANYAAEAIAWEELCGSQPGGAS